MADNIVRFYDDNDKMRCNRPLYLIAEDQLKLEYFKLNKEESKINENGSSQFIFDEFSFDTKKSNWNNKRKNYDMNSCNSLYRGNNKYVVAFDVLWDGLTDNDVEVLAKLVLSQPQVIGVIVYTTMGTTEEAKGRINNLKNWLGENVNKVSEKYVKIGSTDPYSGVMRLKDLANGMFTQQNN